MKFTVVSSLHALQTLTALKNAADDPARIRAADWALRRAPRDQGESRDPGFRVWYEDVLGVFYSIDDAALRVEVLFAGPARRSH